MFTETNPTRPRRESYSDSWACLVMMGTLKMCCVPFVLTQQTIANRIHTRHGCMVGSVWDIGICICLPARFEEAGPPSVGRLLSAGEFGAVGLCLATSLTTLGMKQNPKIRFLCILEDSRQLLPHFDRLEGSYRGAQRPCTEGTWESCHSLDYSLQLKKVAAARIRIRDKTNVISETCCQPEKGTSGKEPWNPHGAYPRYG